MFKADNKVLFPQPPAEVDISRLDASLALPVNCQLATLAIGEDLIDQLMERAIRERKDSSAEKRHRRKARR